MLKLEFTNEQERILVPDKLLSLIKAVAEQTLLSEGFTKDAELNVLLTDNPSIREINRAQRGVDASTDVLSFPMLEFLNGEMDDCAGDYCDGFLLLGDMVLSLEQAALQAAEYGHSFEREVGYLTCHSVLHLLGYDHEKKQERALMREKEEAVMAALNLTRE